jgi:hypothetical protein
MAKRGRLPEYSYRSSAKKEEQIIYRRIGVVVISTGIILFLLFIWGPSLLNSVGLFLSDRDTVSEETVSEEFLTGPHLEILPVATNSALLDIKGYARPEQQIELTLNDVLVGKLDTNEDGTFNFESVRLREATNQLKAVILGKDGVSSQAATATIVYDKTEPDSTVTVNGTQVILGTDQTFDTTTTIQTGENKIKITATDIAGNQTTIERNVTSQ